MADVLCRDKRIIVWIFSSYNNQLTRCSFLLSLKLEDLGNYQSISKHQIISRHFMVVIEYPPTTSLLFQITHVLLSESKRVNLTSDSF